MDFLITLLILLALALLMPYITKQCKESMWKYIKERLELEKEIEEWKEKYFKKQRGD